MYNLARHFYLSKFIFPSWKLKENKTSMKLTDRNIQPCNRTFFQTTSLWLPINPITACSNWILFCLYRQFLNYYLSHTRLFAYVRLALVLLVPLWYRYINPEHINAYKSTCWSMEGLVKRLGIEIPFLQLQCSLIPISLTGYVHRSYSQLCFPSVLVASY